MIHPALRTRLKKFVCEHGTNDCTAQVCILREAQRWVANMKRRGYPAEELLMVALALQAYRAHSDAKSMARQHQARSTTIATA